MRIELSRRLVMGAIAGVACVALAACVAAPDAAGPLAPNAVDLNPLATTFDTLAEAQTEAGDVDRSEEFHWAALAVRAGVTASRFDLANDGQTQTFAAFVQSVNWVTATLAIRPVGHRTLVAYRKSGDTLQVIVISSHTDIASVMNPYSMRPAVPGGTIAVAVAGAQAAYFERPANRSTWVGISGQVKNSEKSTGGACATPTASAPVGITCVLATYNVGFDITFQKTHAEKSRQIDVSAPTKKLTAATQDVNGVKLTLSCVLPVTARGCD